MRKDRPSPFDYTVTDDGDGDGTEAEIVRQGDLTRAAAARLLEELEGEALEAEEEELEGDEEELEGDEEELEGEELEGDDELLGDAELLGAAEILGDAELLGADAEILGADDVASDPTAAKLVARAVTKTLEAARDNRQPSPTLRAVDVDAPERDDELADSLTSLVLGVGCVLGEDAFPRLSSFLVRAGATLPPLIVRVDTEDSYRAFRARSSPEVLELADRVAALEEALRAHIADPDAHEEHELAEEVDAIEVFGVDVAAVEEAKRIDLRLPAWLPPWVRAWRQGKFACVSLLLPGADGEVRLCTSMAPAVRGIEEMARYASEAKVEGAHILGFLPELGVKLAGADVLKGLLSGARSILQRPEARRRAPFVVRLEPKAAPGIMALLALADACRTGDTQACAEWRRLGDAARKGGATVIAQAMDEAQALVAKAAGGMLGPKAA